MLKCWGKTEDKGHGAEQHGRTEDGDKHDGGQAVTDADTDQNDIARTSSL